MTNILANTDGGLITALNSAVVFIDFQPQMLFGVSDIGRQQMINNVTMLAKAARQFDVPVILTAVKTDSLGGDMMPQLTRIFPGRQPIERSSMNSWDSPAFRQAVEATGRKNIILSGLWTEVCVTWPALQMLAGGYNVYVVEDACGATSVLAHEAAMRRCVQAGAVPMTATATVLEFQRDCGDREHFDALVDILREHAGASGSGIEYAYTMVHKASQADSGKRPARKQR